MYPQHFNKDTDPHVILKAQYWLEEAVMPLLYIFKHLCNFVMNAQFKNDWLAVTVNSFALISRDPLLRVIFCF